MNEPCKYCKGNGTLGLPPQNCYYCEGKGFTEKITNDTQVYCTNCKKFQCNLSCINNHGRNDCDCCSCNNCECLNPEDSASFKERPNYIALI